ncbi:hypothetical protein Mgra_00010261, partial [Meloidogyne graminicola]
MQRFFLHNLFTDESLSTEKELTAFKIVAILNILLSFCFGFREWRTTRYIRISIIKVYRDWLSGKLAVNSILVISLYYQTVCYFIASGAADGLLGALKREEKGYDSDLSSNDEDDTSDTADNRKAEGN